MEEGLEVFGPSGRVDEWIETAAHPIALGESAILAGVSAEVDIHMFFRPSGV